MNKMNDAANKIIILAYLHRYGWIVIMLACIAIWIEQIFYILGAGCIGFSIWSLIGYKCKWKHIYCSYQNAYREKMTPHSIRWHKIKKSDALGVPLIFLVFGIISLLLMIFV